MAARDRGGGVDSFAQVVGRQEFELLGAGFEDVGVPLVAGGVEAAWGGDQGRPEVFTGQAFVPEGLAGGGVDAFDTGLVHDEEIIVEDDA